MKEALLAIVTTVPILGLLGFFVWMEVRPSKQKRRKLAAELKVRLINDLKELRFRDFEKENHLVFQKELLQITRMIDAVDDDPETVQRYLDKTDTKSAEKERLAKLFLGKGGKHE